MIKEIIDQLNTQLEATNYFEKQFTLCDIVYNADGSSRPAEYCEGGSFNEVSNFTDYNGMSYIRRNGKTRMNVIDRADIPQKCGDDLLEMTFPLMLVAFVPKEKSSVDNNYTDDEIALTIMKELNGTNFIIKKAVKAKYAEVNVLGWETDNNVILNQEYNPAPIFDMDYGYSYLSMELEVKLIIRQSCIVVECFNPLLRENLSYELGEDDTIGMGE